jgi:aspartyl-tRNA(Asn)/glutamyl-tRNA(Gln) amidotransferase subunit C
MSVTIKDVEYVATLAKLQFTGEEMEKFTSKNVKPLAQIVELQNVLREDIVRPSLPVEEVLANAPAKNEKFFKVPKVINESGNRK